MSEITKGLKEIKKGQNKIVRKLEFIMNGAIAVIGLYNARTSDDKVELVMGLMAAGLATICQGLLVYEDIKEIIDEPDEEEEED
jgi:hypothetical protein